MGTGRTTGRGLPFPVEADAPADPAADIEALANALDPDLEFRSGTAGAKGAAPAHTVAYFETDTGKLALAVGSAWTYPAPSIAVASITTAMLADDAVDDAKIADVDGTKIHADSIPGSALQDNTVAAAKIAAALKPSAGAGAGTEALRALGDTASTAGAGNDPRFSDERLPTDASVTWAKLAGGLVAGVSAGAHTLMASDDARVVGPAAKDDVLQPGVLKTNAAGDLKVTAAWNGAQLTPTVKAGVIWMSLGGVLVRHIVAADGVQVAKAPPANDANPVAGNFNYRASTLWAVPSAWGQAPTYQWTNSAVAILNTNGGAGGTHSSIVAVLAALGVNMPASAAAGAIALYTELWEQPNGGNYAPYMGVDRRPFANGARYSYSRNGPGNYSLNGSNVNQYFAIDDVNLSRRIEVGANGGDVEVGLSGLMGVNATNVAFSIGLLINGNLSGKRSPSFGDENPKAIPGDWVLSGLAPGTYLIQPVWGNQGAFTWGVLLFGDANGTLTLQIKERVAAGGSNGNA